MALVTRARTAGILSLCLLLLSSLSATGALAGAAPPQTAAPQAAAIVIGTGSCVGEDACTNAVGPIGDNSCNGINACRETDGSIGDNSCNGNSFCLTALGPIGDNSCNLNGCPFSISSVGDYSCNANFACYQMVGSVGNYSCNGAGACDSVTANYGDCVNNTTVPPICEVQPDARIRRIGKHNMVGNDIYNTDGTNQTLSDTLGDKAVRFVITIQNDGDVASSFTIGSSNGVTLTILPPVNFYHGWPAQDITAAVMAGTYTTPTIAPGGIYRIRAVVRPLQINVNHLAAGPGIPHYSWLVTATNTLGNPAKADAVRFEVDVPFT